MDLAPEQARVLADDGSEHLVPVEEVTVGTRYVVRPGERIPLDGLVVDGASSVDEAPITGESVPVDKQPDSTVFAGTLNAQGALTVRGQLSGGVHAGAMSDDLTLPDALTGARQATRVMRQNVIASLAVKAVFVVLAPLGLVTLVLAVAADMGMSLLVTLNGLRLLRRRSTRHAAHAADRRVAHASTRTPSAARSHGSGGNGDWPASER